MTLNVTHPQLNYRPANRKTKRGRKQRRIEKSHEKFVDHVTEHNATTIKHKSNKPRSGISRGNTLEMTTGGVQAGWNAVSREFEVSRTMGQRPDLKRAKQKNKTGIGPTAPHPQRVKEGCV